MDKNPPPSNHGMTDAIDIPTPRKSWSETLREKVEAAVQRGKEKAAHGEANKGIKDALIASLVRVAERKAKADEKDKYLPNRTDMRRRGLNINRRGQGHARISGAKKTPASFHTLVSIPLRNSNGDFVRRVVVPRSMMEKKDD